jgi:hypothetical protein
MQAKQLFIPLSLLPILFFCENKLSQNVSKVLFEPLTPHMWTDLANGLWTSSRKNEKVLKFVVTPEKKLQIFTQECIEIVTELQYIRTFPNVTLRFPNY